MKGICVEKLVENKAGFLKCILIDKKARETDKGEGKHK